MKKAFALALAAALTLTLLAGCGGASKPSSSTTGSAAAPIVLKLSHPNNDGHAYDMAAKRFKELVEERTAGRYTITIFPNSALGSQEEVTEAAQLGTIDLVVTSDDKLVNLVPEFGALGMPFLFEDYDHVKEVLNGDVGAMLSDKLAQKGVIVISWFENGFRNITTTNRPVIKPEDLNGVKIRVSSAKTNMALFEKCGAVVTNVSFSELYTALQLGTVDAQENPFGNLLDKKFYEVQKYLSLSNHVHTSEPLIMSKATFDRLSDEDKAIFIEAGREASDYAFDFVKSEAEGQLEQLKTLMQVSEIDRDSFEAASQSVYDQYYAQFKDIIDQIKK